VPGVRAPDTYVPKHLAEKILASRHKLEGERKQVTVLFADIKGSTKLVETLDPEEAQKIIDPVLHIMMDAVHRYEGTVNQVLGDGIMALFGAPLAHEDHALRACYAALAMQDEMRRYRQRLGQSEESGLHIGVGLNSGEVVVRSIDTDLNIDYSALGHTTHLAARMQELAGPDIALMSASTLRQVEGFVQVQSLGPVQAKGLSQPVEAYSLIGATTARTRVQAGAVRGLTPLVGRSTEIDIFNKLVQRVSAGRGQILAMIGEPGIGKSRLVHEFTRHQLPPDWLVLEGASASYGKATSYFPIIEMLRRYFGIGPGEGSEDIQTRVVTQILELDSALKDAIAPILSLLGALPDKKITDQDRDWLAIPSSAAGIPWMRSSEFGSGKAEDKICCWFSKTSIGSTTKPKRFSTCWLKVSPWPASFSWPTTGPSTTTNGRIKAITLSSGSIRFRPVAPKNCCQSCSEITQTSRRSNNY
jgi:class 3 adenylate cyclase